MNGPSSPFAKLYEVVSVAFYFELIGVVYSICFFAFFGINYADYADLNDLLLGSFKEPVVFVAALGVVLFVVLKESSHTASSTRFLVLLAPVALAALMAIVAYYYVTWVERAMPFSNTGIQVEVLLSESLNFEEGELDRRLETVRLLGRSGDYFFFFDTLTRDNQPRISTIILPRTSIVWIAAERPN